MGGQPPALEPPVTAQELFRFMIQHNINDTKIFEILCGTLNNARYLQMLRRIDRVNGLPKPNRISKPSWEGRKNRVKGQLFEVLIGIVLRCVKPFTGWTNVNSSTSEIDWLVQIGPTAALIPALRDWGTHFLCECKFSHETVSIQWVTNLNTVLQTHNANVGLLFTTRGLSNRGNGVRAVRQIEMLSVMTPARFIVCVNAEDMHLCGNGFNFLQLVSQRYVETKANTGRLRLLGN
jgi:hypothetical protein